MRVIVCGGRDFADRELLFDILDELHRDLKFAVVIEGGAKGADRFAREWAKEKHIKVETFEADWMLHGASAGVIRNQQMIDDGNPHLVVAFYGGKGTADMVRRAKRAGIKGFKVLSDGRTRPLTWPR